MNVYLRVAALAGFLAVALGAFGAHALKATFEANGAAGQWEKAVLYHAIHAVMLWVLASRTVVPLGPWWLFLAGIVLFSGSLYVLAATGARWVWPLTPLGGLCFLAGWLWLALGLNGRV